MLEPLLNDCRNLIRVFPNYTMTHIFKEANKYANRLTKMGVIQLIDFLILYQLLPVVDNLLVFDKATLL